MGLKNDESFQKKCRLCGRPGRRFTDIFTPKLQSAETKPNRKLSQLIYKCLQLQVKEDDSLPKKICDDCNKKLSSWQNFYKKCEQTQKRLQQYLENWQKSSVCVPSSSVACSDISRDITQVSLGDEIPEETIQTKLCVLPKKVKDISSVNSVTKDDMPVINKIVKDDEYKHRKNTSKIKNISEGTDNSYMKVRKLAARSQKNSTCPRENDSTAVQAHVIVISEENEQTQEHFIAATTDCVKRVNLSKSSLKTKEPTEVHQCHICEKPFPSHGKLNAHVAGHLRLPEFQCDKCSKKFRSKFSLRSHLETHSASRNYCCHLCGRLFHTASGLCNHVKLHSEEAKRFTCPLCSKQFRQAGHLEQHQRTHTGERPHQCTECEQRFTTRCQLSRHVQGVHRCAKKYKCLMCGKEFLYSTNFKAHLLRHAGQRNNKCGECGKTFVTSNALFRHRRSHTGDKPFQCDICGKKFADCSNRKRHMLRHLQQPAVPRGRKSGPRPKLARVMNLKGVASAQQEQCQTSKEVQLSDEQDDTKVYSQLVQVSALPSVISSQTEGNTNITSSQNIRSSGEVVQLCSGNSGELDNLTSVCMSHLPQQLNVSSVNSQLSSYNSLITDSSNIYVSLSQDPSQLIHLSTQNTNLLIRPLGHDVAQLVEGGHRERLYVNQLGSAKENLGHSGHKLNHTSKTNGSTLCTMNVMHEVSIQQNSKAKVYQDQEGNRNLEVDKPKTYANLRTFLESSEVVEALSGGKSDDHGDGDNGVINVECVTLMAADGNGASFTSGVQEIIVLPRETKIADYDLSRNAGKFQMVIQGNEDSTGRSACCTEQIRKENTEPATVLTDTCLPSQNGNVDSHLLLAADKGKAIHHVLQTSSTNSDNLIEVFLSNTEESKLPVNTETVNDRIQDETLDSSNLIQVLLESHSNSVTAQQENIDRTRQTFPVSSDGFTDEDAIIQMLNSQGTVMLPATRTDFDLTESPIAEVTQLIEGASEAAGMAIREGQTHSVLNFKTFSSEGGVVMCEIAGRKGENNVNIDLIPSDYSHEISLTTAITLDNSHVNSVVRKGMSEDQETGDEVQSADLQVSDHSGIPTASMDDIEMFGLCAEDDLTKLAPIYQTGKSIENV